MVCLPARSSNHGHLTAPLSAALDNKGFLPMTTIKRVISEHELKKIERFCPLCNHKMIQTLLDPSGPRIIFLICEHCNIIPDYYFIKESNGI